MQKIKIRLVSLADLDVFTKSIQSWIRAENLQNGIVLALSGNLGAGKTTFAKSLLKQVGIRKQITSPTFVLMNIYAGGRPKRNFFHLDAYRTKNFKDLASLGIEEIWRDPKSVVLIEWADKIKSKLPGHAVLISLKANPDNSRTVVISNAPPKLQKMLKLLKS